MQTARPTETAAMRLMAALGLAAALTSSAASAAAPQPVVVELFTSQGCSSCPPANETLSRLAGRADVLALSFGVTYWDQLGWKDTFASSQFTARQWDYARGLKHAQVWTPQMVVDGRADSVGQTLAQIEPVIAAARARHAEAPAIEVAGGQVTLASGKAPKAAADVWLVRYDPREVQVPIRRGENGGRTLPHRNVVRELTRLGAWSGGARTYPIKPSTDPALSSAVLVQAGPGGAIIAAAKG